MKNHCVSKDRRCPVLKRMVYKPNGRYSSLIPGTVPAAFFGMEREITYQNTNHPHRQ